MRRRRADRTTLSGPAWPGEASTPNWHRVFHNGVAAHVRRASGACDWADDTEQSLSRGPHCAEAGASRPPLSADEAAGDERQEQEGEQGERDQPRRLREEAAGRDHAERGEG